MVRPLRQVFPELPHHVRQRGVRKNAIFHEDSDYLLYLRTLKDACLEFAVKIWAYVLMINHVHLIAVPKEEESISNALQKAHTRYSTYCNEKYGYVGHVWQSRPKMSVMDDAYAKNAIPVPRKKSSSCRNGTAGRRISLVECSGSLWITRGFTDLAQSLHRGDHELVRLACNRPARKRVTRNSAPSLKREAMV
jgi:REP element-mobilizing transposase RayT